MKKNCLLFIVLLLLSCPLMCCKEEKPDWGPEDLVATAREAVEARARGDFESAHRLWDEETQKKITPAMSRKNWYKAYQTKETGAFKRIIGARMAKRHGRDCVLLKCVFEKKIVDIIVCFTKHRKIRGMGPEPTDPLTHYEPVAEVKADPGETEKTLTRASAEPIALAKQFVTLLAKGDFDAAENDFDQRMNQAMSSKKLKDAWESFCSQVGSFKRQVGVRTEETGGYTVVFVKCEFSKADFDISLAFDDNRKIAGLHFVPANPSAEYKSL